jgi:hypothetical protein
MTEWRNSAAPDETQWRRMMNTQNPKQSETTHELSVDTLDHVAGGATASQDPAEAAVAAILAYYSKIPRVP